MKNKAYITSVLCAMLAITCICGCTAPTNTSTIATNLPTPTISEGMRGELGIDANINESTLDQYLNKDDIVYRDMRMLIDPANYEAIEGDSYLSGYVDGFEVVPYPYLAPTIGLPEAVGTPYQGPTLFSIDDNGSYIANYEESINIIHDLFPQDKTIFLMCGGGGYAGMTKNLLVNLGYDESKIYNVGGYWYYNGEHKIDVAHKNGEKTTYDFHNVPYHIIEFDVLHPTNGYKPQKDTGTQKLDDTIDEASIKGSNITQLETLDELDTLIDNNNTFILYTYLPGCTSCASFTPVINDFAKTRQASVFQISYNLIKDTDHEITNLVKYTPTVLIYRDGKIVDMLSPTEDEDLEYYKTLEAFSTWLSQQLNVNVVTSDTVNNTVGCEEGCEA